MLAPKNGREPGAQEVIRFQDDMREVVAEKEAGGVSSVHVLDSLPRWELSVLKRRGTWSSDMRPARVQETRKQ